MSRRADTNFENFQWQLALHNKDRSCSLHEQLLEPNISIACNQAFYMTYQSGRENPYIPKESNTHLSMKQVEKYIKSGVENKLKLS